MAQQADLYAQMGIAAILPGLTRAVEILQSEIDGLREMLSKAAGGEPIIPRRGRPAGIPNKPRKKQAHTNGSVPVPTAQLNAKGEPIKTTGAGIYWAALTPAQRSAEMKRRQKVSQGKAASVRKRPDYRVAAGKASWAKMSKKAKAARVEAMNAARLAKRVAAKTEARVQ